MKQCPDCKKLGVGPKPHSEFNCSRSNPGGRDTYCKICRSARARARYVREGDTYKARRVAWQSQNPSRLKLYDVRKRIKEYGLSEAQYVALFTAQQGCCAICRNQIISHFEAARNSEASPESRLTARVDHCHTTGSVRGLLCLTCNASLGGFRDNEQLLLNAVRYLRESATATGVDRSQHDTLQGETEPLSRDLGSSTSRGRRQPQLNSYLN